LQVGILNKETEVGFFNSLFGGKIENENSSKPFHMNSNPLERKVWFSRTRPWNRIDSKIIDALINRFGNNPMFEVFVVTSIEHNLVLRYEQLNKIDQEEAVICSIIATMLCEVGTHSAKKMIALHGDFQKNMKEVRKCYGIVRNTLETAIILDENQIAAYAYLSVVLGLIEKFDDGLKYARQGIAKIQEIRKSNVPFHLSDIDVINNACETMDDIEKTLRKLEEDYIFGISRQAAP
jgi:hypothetical protein